MRENRWMFVGARVLTPFEAQDVRVLTKGGKIEAMGPALPLPESAVRIRADALPERMPEGDVVIDAQGLYLAPGYVDIHVHGGGGFSAMSGKPEDVVAMGNAHARHGTTSLLPTTLAAPIPETLAAIAAIREAAGRTCDASIAGVHLEGPYLSPAQSGAQSPEDLITPEDVDAGPLLDAWPGGVKMMGVAPELPGALALGERLAALDIVASIAHSNATYAQVEEAVAHGYSDVTHLYSGCSGLIRINSYRIPGVIEAGLNLDSLTAQVIADGKHLPKELLQLIVRCKGTEGVILITDGLEYAAAELTEGTVYRQPNGMETLYEDGVMKLTNRQAFAGSVATMDRLVRTMLDAGVPLLDAVRMATENPARRVGLADKGRIQAGMDADLLLLDERARVRAVFAQGRRIA